MHLPGVLNNPLLVVDDTLYVTSGPDLYAFPTHCLAAGARCGPDWVGKAPELTCPLPWSATGRCTSARRTVLSRCSRWRAAGAGKRVDRLGPSPTSASPNPSLVDGVLFVGSTWAEKELLAFDADCGASGATCVPLWTFVVTDFGAFQQPTASDGNGTLFAVTGDPAGEGTPVGRGPYAFRVRTDSTSGEGASADARSGASSMDIVTVAMLGAIAALLMVQWRRRRSAGINIEG